MDSVPLEFPVVVSAWEVFEVSVGVGSGFGEATGGSLIMPPTEVTDSMEVRSKTARNFLMRMSFSEV